MYFLCLNFDFFQPKVNLASVKQEKKPHTLAEIVWIIFKGRIKNNDDDDNK